MIQIQHFSTYTHGGAAIAARRLHDSLVSAGANSVFCSRDRPPDYLIGYQKARFAQVARTLWERAIAKLTRVPRKWAFQRQIARYLIGRPAGFEQFSVPRLPEASPLLTEHPGNQIVHLHWVADFFDFPTFFASLHDEIPIVWTLHDMNPFTGGCHYDFNCGRFTIGCGHCPQLNHRRGDNDLSATNYRLKASCLQNKQLHIAADSHWLLDEAKKSPMLAQARSFQTIHYGLDTRVFVPRPQAACRQALGIPSDAFVVCFGADGVQNRRKGFRELMGALQHIVGTDCEVLTFGAGGIQLDSTLDQVKARHFGRVESADFLCALYSASDLFVIPSLQEAFGQTSLEAMACGKPVVGFNTGGIPDMVRPGISGLLASPGDVEDLALKIEWMRDHPDEAQAMGREARKIVEQEFTLDIQVHKYQNLYETILPGQRLLS